jgi:DNA-binding transcriptional ArsR family regulator
MDDVGPVLVALADPTRRAILERVREGPRSVTEIASAFSVSRPAVSQHLRVLVDAGLLRSHREGRENLYGLNLQGMIALRAYLDQFWDDVFGAFQAAAEIEAKQRRKKN